MVIGPGRRMVARQMQEQHRVSTPLELLFDLTFVVAVSAAAAELSRTIAQGRPAQGLIGYLMVFFAIWWAWMNFTWFASAYDVDDVLYRLLTLIQMAGVLVLAAGVPAAFERSDYTAVTAGYVIMRIAMVAQWLRAARDDRPRHVTAMRYVVGTVIVQVGWVLRLDLPAVAGIAFAVLVVAELAVPVWAERREQTSWHPHHIAERYGLFTIIVLGECVLAATTAVGEQTGTHLGAIDLLVVAVGGLALLFALWWLYFLKPAGEALAARRSLAFWWGYGHYGVFAATAALGAALEAATERALHPVAATDAQIGWAVAVPVAVFVLLVWGLHAPLGAAPAADVVPVLACALAVLAAPVVTFAGISASWVVALTVVPVAALVSSAGRGRAADPGVGPPGQGAS